MKVDKEALHKVAHLARLNVKPEEEPKLIEDLSKILTWVEQLKEVDTTGVAPLTHMTAEVNVLRKDVAEKTISHEAALKNAPSKNEDFFKVPKVLKRND
ncbi:Asp-tRNA(Asn)/Glu-tRNA(Gln) amidotransferase subunit GatC [Roseivirga pacifica]|uniref:Asp-tRNA(Asn)/Glu-tRNA(Gln) amidotransferase subunit GatC n=1 Tax=Roseivirga pacifica TaxID=1267423 RepID=UPI002095CEE3|nr:Asp-tRNA(Asn)/Glu-tRNA(Gln) amidotransferase subunit GatC [Roseivirga pacifica]MCO6360192.1 Asp-tRNA(Asn)/Glu-tRNA(Gln) amidotransferase subunit GatC [Roseivirga pacifica]MCO6367563.1 Asp-tRNA(Asn)/Glu-tRNA(Gln) amidotransferase subunit GatC [Roseivirga pacifica]MCO6369905.1 Asp-tRNA(Asn)/Glu-tRNA(Gln) amidotransferase subunit GatC [Roseivirga pacifica]MCO6375220.1 Asp-tRNA(Asn)/Glu-tRNA(Gln) amidotransferase subunit GatC [Roseivirga pacifica]MCO6380478.1 Asp-tRNA(Asn)/Glu-tRNA(Gln) amidotr